MIDKQKKQSYLSRLVIKMSDWNVASRSKIELVITIGYVTVLMFSILAAYLTVNHVADWFLFNADTLWNEDFLRDWLINNVDMKTWMTPGAPNYFPELLLYGLFRFAAGSVYGGFLGFGFIKIVFYGFFFYALLSSITHISIRHKLWFSLLGVSVLLLTTILLGSQFDYTRMLDFWQLFSPGGHGGAIANALIAILLMLCWFRSPGKEYFWLFLLFLLSVLASLSDRLYMVWFAVPALGAMACLFVLGYASWRSVAALTGVLLISDMLGRKIFLWLVPFQQVPYQNSLEAGWKSTLRFYSELFREGWYHPLVLFSYTCLVIITFYVLFKTWNHPDTMISTQKKGILFLLSYSTLVLPISFLGMMYINRPETQYFTGGDLLALSLWALLLVITPFGLRLWNNAWFHMVIIVTLLGYIGFLATSSPLPLPMMLTPADPYSPLIACLDSHRNDLGNGLGVADYWQVREIDLFSQKGLDADQAMGEDLRLFQWASNREMFEGRKYTFVMTNTPTNLSPILEEDVIRVYGKPDTRFVCAGFPILIYQDGIPIQTPLAEQVEYLRKGKVDKITIESELDAPNGIGVGERRDGALYSMSVAGWLQFGPYVTFPSGSYRVEWRGEVQSTELEEIGTVDVAYGGGTNIVARTEITRASLESLPKGQLAALEFFLNEDIPSTEFRFYVNKNVVMRIDEVVIIRLP